MQIDLSTISSIQSRESEAKTSHEASKREEHSFATSVMDAEMLRRDMMRVTRIEFWRIALET
jgi:hypothetical protein